MRLVVALATWLGLRAPTLQLGIHIALAAAELGEGTAQEGAKLPHDDLPELPRDALGYCPPIQDAFQDYSCIRNEPETGNLRFLMSRVEEALWAVASLREAGWLNQGKAANVVEFLESEMLLLCWVHLDCAFQGEGERNYWVSQFIQRCQEMQLRAPLLEGVENREDICMDWDLQTALIERILHYLAHEKARSQPGPPAHAWLPAEVSHVCVGRAVEEPPGPMVAWSRLNGQYGFHTLFVRAHPMIAALHLVLDGKTSPFVVNLGASDGTCEDTGGIFSDLANCAFERGAVGLAVEGRQGEKLSGRWPGVEVHSGYISPGNVSQIIQASFQRQGARHIELLKIDLDHADCVFAEEVLRNLPLPNVLRVEYSRALPPPIRLRERFSEETVDSFAQVDDSWEVFTSRRHWGGCSMQAWHDLVDPLGYKLLQADFNDLMFVRSELVELLGLGPLPERSLFEHWLSAAHCVAPGRHLHGLQLNARFDLRALAEAGPEDRCRLAKAWWEHEGAGTTSDLWC